MKGALPPPLPPRVTHKVSVVAQAQDLVVVHLLAALLLLLVGEVEARYAIPARGKEGGGEGGV